MIFDKNILQCDLKVQDSYRKILATLGPGVQLKCIVLGDSDIDYELSPNLDNARILNAPYKVNGIKYPLLYNGSGKGLKGKVTCFARKVLSDGSIQGLYSYPLNSTFTTSRVPPSVENGYDWNVLPFTNSKSGYILFFQTLLDYYLDVNGQPQRLKEKFKITITFNGSSTIPVGWQIIIDDTNGSLLIGKDFVTVSSLSVFDGKIEIESVISKNKKTIKFNF